MTPRIEIEGVMFSVDSGFTLQVRYELEEKEKFWSEVDDVMQSFIDERAVIGADFNGHVGEINGGDEEVMSKFGVQGRNADGGRLWKNDRNGCSEYFLPEEWRQEHTGGLHL